jgi:hypothetical protein
MKVIPPFTIFETKKLTVDNIKLVLFEGRYYWNKNNYAMYCNMIFYTNSFISVSNILLETCASITTTSIQRNVLKQTQDDGTFLINIIIWLSWLWVLIIDNVLMETKRWP